MPLPRNRRPGFEPLVGGCKLTDGDHQPHHCHYPVEDAGSDEKQRPVENESAEVVNEVCQKIHVEQHPSGPKPTPRRIKESRVFDCDQ